MPEAQIYYISEGFPIGKSIVLVGNTMVYLYNLQLQQVWETLWFFLTLPLKIYYISNTLKCSAVRLKTTESNYILEYQVVESKCCLTVSTSLLIFNTQHQFESLSMLWREEDMRWILLRECYGDFTVLLHVSPNGIVITEWSILVPENNHDISQKRS